MSTVEISFAMPKDIIDDLDRPSDFGYQSFVLGLFLDEEISLGKAARLLNMSYDEFIDFLGKKKIPYFRNTPEEINEALEKLNSI
jgi:predicted HTH domain antitoxin